MEQQQERTFIVTVTHPTTEKWSCKDEVFICRTTDYGKDVRWYANCAKYGCSRNYTTPERAIAGMLNEHACTVVSIVEGTKNPNRTLTTYDIVLEITPATQHATAYLDNRPIASVHARRVYTKDPPWVVYKVDGTLWFTTNWNSVIRSRIARLLNEERTK